MRTRRVMFTALALALACSSACSVMPARDGREIFDETTGDTLTVVSKPLVFARERSDLAAHARDYATLVAIEVDHAGTAKQYLLLHRWSMLDVRMAPRPNPDAGKLRLLAAGRDLEMTPLDSSPVGVGLSGAVFAPQHGASVSWAYDADVALLRFIAASGSLTLQFPQDSLATAFAVWDDGRAQLEAFIRQTVAPR